MSYEWAAGLFEGEGCIKKDKRKRATFELLLGMSDLDVVNRFRDVVGAGSVIPQKQRFAHHKPMWRWSVTNKKDIRRILELLLPHFGQRRSYVALNCLDDIDSR